jgi:3-methyl-2-oxobutanoate hydroxymethyltransferase|tara:strand:+ start:302 stop:1150 length:849 start_codon:yes stop_codon:yes gene_type:complete
MAKRLTAPVLTGRKVARGAKHIVMVTAADYPSGCMIGETDADMILVGDSLAMVVLGYNDTLSVTIEDMVHHTAAVARAKPKQLIVGDLPWMSYHVSTEDTLRNAAKLIRAGAGAIKLEGGRTRVPMIEALIDAHIPVMGHIGLTPQSVHAMGGFRVQGKSAKAAHALVAEARALQTAGCFAIVLEGVPREVGDMVTASLDIPIVGIGAGPGCDGQVLVLHDLLGMQDNFVPKFVRQYANLKADSITGISAYVADVRSGSFPDDSESYHIADDQVEALGLYGG